MKKLTFVHYIVIVLVLLSLSMSYAYFTVAGNFNSPIIEFEFVKSVSDVEGIFIKDNIINKNMVEGVDKQNYIDFAYMLAYSIFLALVFISISKQKNEKLFLIGVLLALIAFVSDFFENVQLLNISDNLLSGNNYLQDIKYLMIFTYIKWLSLAIALFMLSFYYFRYNILGKIFSVLSSIPLIFVLFYLFMFSKQIEILFSFSVMIGFVILFIWVYSSSVFYKS